VSPSGAGAMLLALAFCTAACALHFRRAVGGVTGDLLGMAEQITEIAASFALVLTLRSG
jgi:cobalamin synthase